MKDEKTIMKERCDMLRSVFSAVFWVIAAFEILLLISGLWLAFQPVSEFSVSLADTPAGMLAIVRFSGLKEGLLAEFLSEMTFDPGVLNEAAGQASKYVYLVKHFSNAAVGMGVAVFLWYLKEIFRNIKRFETPFIKENSRALFRMGVAAGI